MNSPFNELTVCTYSTGSTMVREVLVDWLEFLGGKPRKVLFAVSSVSGLPTVYGELQAEGLIDEVKVISQTGRTILENEPLAVHEAIQAVNTEWVILLKLDTLPFRRGSENWLEQDLQLVRERNLFGITGSFLVQDLLPLDDGHSITHKYSNNFAIFRRDEWLKVIQDKIGPDWSGPIAKHAYYQGDDRRYATEAAIEEHLRESGRGMLVRHESNDWSVFHVNVWGERLRQVRDSYRRREHITPFLNTGQPVTKPLLYLWQHYYMYPAPSRLRRMRIWLGRKRRELLSNST